MDENMIALMKGHAPEELGELPYVIDQRDPRPAREQFDANYPHGGGWRPAKGFTNKGFVLRYSSDPELMPIAMWPLREEMIVVYRYGFVAIFQKDGSFEVARLS